MRTTRGTGFTTRGSCLLAAGLTALACGIVLGEVDLVRAGVLAAALPLLALLTSVRRRPDLEVRRLTGRQRAVAGQPLYTSVHVTNRSVLPTVAVQAADSADPAGRTSCARFAIESLAGRETRVVPYSIGGLPRGRHILGPILLTTRDALGLRTDQKRVAAPLEVLVVPSVEPLGIAGSTAIAAAGAARLLGSVGSDDASTREYQVGDDLRRVHWRSTARTGSLMVRQEASNDKGRLGLLLSAQPAERADSTTTGTEWAVSAAASIGVHLLAGRLRISLAHDPSAVAARQLDDPETLLDVLADYSGMSDQSRPVRGTEHLLTQLQADPQVQGVYAVLGRLDRVELQTLSTAPVLRSRRLERFALLVDVGSWGDAPGEVAPTDAAAALHHAGWHTVVAGRGVSMGQAWADLNAHGGVRS